MRFANTRPVAVGCFLALTAIVGPWAGVAEAQYFGRNKVQYEDFDFKTLKTEHFDILYYPEARTLGGWLYEELCECLDALVVIQAQSVG